MFYFFRQETGLLIRSVNQKGQSQIWRAEPQLEQTHPCPLLTERSPVPYAVSVLLPKSSKIFQIYIDQVSKQYYQILPGQAVGSGDTFLVIFNPLSRGRYHENCAQELFGNIPLSCRALQNTRTEEEKLLSVIICVLLLVAMSWWCCKIVFCKWITALCGDCLGPVVLMAW